MSSSTNSSSSTSQGRHPGAEDFRQHVQEPSLQRTSPELLKHVAESAKGTRQRYEYPFCWQYAQSSSAWAVGAAATSASNSTTASSTNWQSRIANTVSRRK
ncbi:hypothetical protein TraAM80_10572 [Trypanosoma rangeli]|uniref:Uncharacterized protein n=1 Tax=Trypanosoma rangeli TaxID=5698 RepID=A0A422MNN1_TRYRA|nr:uncharacterized protein TraAM80_10572 [Trypanosoma rangeli]RNE94818.1 hypothetical protein TraAM80_10572 [Trypanosoma rangeli]|eukprot:RNE94818.1 hypothetical protein TraAM80_10572 [Trypanosoma rangeli]